MALYNFNLAENTGFVNLASGDMNALKTAVATIGPISGSIDAPSFLHVLTSLVFTLSLHVVNQ